MQKRVQKWLAEAGVASRRGAEEMIRAGRVAVNGRIVTLGESTEAGGEITLDGRPIASAVGSGGQRKLIYIALNKPPGYVVTASDPQGRPTVMDLVSDLTHAPGATAVRLFPVGRLDFETAGLIFMTNDGGWANKVSHPRHGTEKVYRANIQGVPDVKAIRTLREGVLLEDGRTAPARVKMLDDGRIEIAIREGKNRQVRRMCEAVGHPVTRLSRVAIGGIKLGKLKQGAWRSLTPREVASLQN